MQNNQWNEIGIKIFYTSILILGCCAAWLMFTYSYMLIIEIILEIIHSRNEMLTGVLFYGGICLGFFLTLYIFVRLSKKIIKKTKHDMPDDEQMIILIKNAAKEGQFNNIPTKEMEDIYQYGLGLVKSRPYDDDLIKAVDQFKTEIEIKLSWEDDSKVNSTKKLLIICALIPLPWIFWYLIGVFVDHVCIDSTYIKGILFLLAKQAFILILIYIVYKIIIWNKNNIAQIFFDLSIIPPVLLAYYTLLLILHILDGMAWVLFMALLIVFPAISAILCAIGVIIKMFKRNVSNVKITVA